MSLYAIYTKQGYLAGVPAKDMTKSEWEALPKELQDKALKAGTHKIVSARKKKEDESSEEVKNG